MNNLILDMKCAMRLSLLLLHGIVGFQTSAQQFSKDDVLSDLEYLKGSLEDTHINIYAYTSKEEFEENYNTLKKQIIDDSLSLLEVTNLFQKVVARANNGHTRIAYGSQFQPYINYFQSGGTIFPLEVVVEGGKVLIRKNWSTNTSIQIGDEIQAINGMPIGEILSEIYPLIAAERPYFKNALLAGMTFPRYYWQVFGEQKKFKVEIVQNGKASTQVLEAIKAFDDYENKRYDILRLSREFKSPSNNMAYLRPGEFGGDLEHYKRFIDSAFADIHSKKQNTLIIDLRNHPGGDDPFGDYLVSYFADEPFKWSSSFRLKSSALLKKHIRKQSDTTTAYARSILKHKDGEIYDYDFGVHEPQPHDKRFRGAVYVLVNRMSYSQSTVTAAQIQDYGWGTIIGEETGEFPNLYASIFTYQLPKTGISVDVSKGKMQRISGVDDGRGVIPDILIKDHLLDEQDEILEGLLKKLNTGK